jgi:predicted P-loop ATPase
MGDVIDLAGRANRGPASRFPVALGRTVKTHRVENREFTWQQFTDRFRTPIVTGETIAQYMEMSVDMQGKIKDVGYFVPGHFEGEVRHKENLNKRYLGCLDIDHAGEQWQEAVRDTYATHAYILHSTHKHRPKHPRLRMIFPLSRPCRDLEYQAVVRRLASWWDMDVFDRTGFEFSRVMHFPSVPRDANYVFEDHPGAFVDVDAVLSTYLDFKNINEWPLTGQEKTPPRVGSKKAENPLIKKGVVGAFCRAYSIEEAMEEFLPEIYTSGSTSNRYTYTEGSGANGVVLYDDDAGSDFIWMFSHHETDPAGGLMLNAFDMVRLHLFGKKDVGVEPGTQSTELRSYKAMSKLARADKKVGNELAEERHSLATDFESFEDDDDSMDENLGLEPVDDGLDDLPTRKKLKKPAKQAAREEKEVKWQFRTDSDGSLVKSSLHNAVGLLETAKPLRGCIRHNLFTDELLQMRRLPGMKVSVPKEGCSWSDLAEISIKAYLDKTHDICFSTNLIHEACMRVGNLHACNPPREWMNSLVWDGVDRLDTVLVRYMGAQDNDYVRAVTRKWFCQGVARMLKPGCQADHMLVLEGLEGKKKSTFYRVISKGFFTDDLYIGLESKELVERTRRAWIVEVQEMITKSNADTKHTKAFISRRAETVRMAYGRNATTYPRHFILGGSTNEDVYLGGVTGNRRVWPVKGNGKQIDIVALEMEVDQIWAEAKEMWVVFNEPLYLENKKTLRIAEAQQEARTEDDSWGGTVSEWLKQEVHKNYLNSSAGSADDFSDDETKKPRDRVCIPEVWVECLKQDIGRLTPRDARRIGDILKRAGWKPNHVMRFGKRYGSQKGFIRKP